MGAQILLHFPGWKGCDQGVTWVDAQGGAGSVTPVGVADCEIACEMAQPQCSSFSYNGVLQQCFLKSGGGRTTCVSQTVPCYEANQNLQVGLSSKSACTCHH